MLLFLLLWLRIFHLIFPIFHNSFIISFSSFYAPPLLFFCFHCPNWINHSLKSLNPIVKGGGAALMKQFDVSYVRRWHQSPLTGQEGKQ